MGHRFTSNGEAESKVVSPLETIAKNQNAKNAKV
jgi:hypothetical protein